MATNDYAVSPKRSFNFAPHPKRRRDPGYLSTFLRPPAPDSVSEYARFQGLKVVEGEQKNKQDVEEGRRPVYVRDHAPVQRNESESEEALESRVKVKEKPMRKDPADALKLSTDGDRVEFQIQGHDGPKTYVFGFDTGDAGNNRQFRLEERLKDGTVKGHYGYYDARGKLRTITYEARPFGGYEERHHVVSGKLTMDVN